VRLAVQMSARVERGKTLLLPRRLMRSGTQFASCKIKSA
jgi:hypothetical protein